jgi:hypothetical protein
MRPTGRQARQWPWLPLFLPFVLPPGEEEEYYFERSETAAGRKGISMVDRKSIASILLFAGSALCFFFPFVTVSCGAVRVFTLTGQQLATGGAIEMPQVLGPSKSQRVDPNPLASGAALCALAGVVLSFAGRRLAAGAAVSGAVGTVSLGVLASRMGGEVRRLTEGLGQSSLEVGFILAVCLMVAATAWNIYLLSQGNGNLELRGEGGSSAAGREGASPGDSSAGPDNQESPDADSTEWAGFGFCAKCGAKQKDASPFCNKCRARL